MTYHLLVVRQNKLIQEFLELSYGHRCYLINIFISDCDCQGFLFQSLPMACLTGCDPHECLILLLHGLGACLPVPPLHILYQTFKGYIIDTFTSLASVVDLNLPASCSVDEHVPYFLRQLVIRSAQIKFIFLGQSIQDSSCEASLVRT